MRLPPPIILRPYQETAAAEVIATLDDNPILVLPTGGGKTATASAIVKRLRKRTLWVAHRQELIGQADAALRALGLRTEIICASLRPHGEPEPQVWVASPQTLRRRNMPPVTLAVMDEAHHYPELYLTPTIGLTATPFRLDGRGLGAAGFGRIVVGAYADDLCRDGTLHEPLVYAGHAPDLRGVRTMAGDYAVSGLAMAVDKPELVGDIVGTWRKRAAGKRTVAFAVNVAHSQSIVEAFREAGIPAVHLDGTTPPDARRDVLAALRSGEVSIVSNCMVLTEGWDLPALEVAIVARPTASLNLHLQMIGRIMRAADGKDGAIVLDHAGNHHVHGRVTRRLEYSLGGRVVGESEPLGLRRCQACQLLYDPAAPCCPECGWVPSTVDAAVSSMRVRDGELVEFAEDYEYRAEFWRLIVAQAAASGYRPGWAAYRYKERFGAWPLIADGELINEKAATREQKREVYRALLETAREKGFKDGWASVRYRDAFGVWPSGFVSELRGGEVVERWNRRIQA